MIKRFSKAQISIFVIVSIILVIGAITLISLNSDSIQIFTDQKSSYKVKEYVESCLELQTKEAINLIGAHSGWLYHKDMILTDRSKPPIYNRRAKGLNFLEQVPMPYWYYYDDANEVFTLNIPEYDTEGEYSIKNQVKKYLEDNLEKNCIQSFTDFEDVYEIKYEPKEIKGKISVDFEEDEIVSSLDLPLEIHEKNSENVEYVDFFSITAENKLWVPYHLALDITIAEMNSSFVEKRINHFLSPYKRSDTRDLLPPNYDYQMKYDFAPWDVKEVEKLTKDIISSNIRLIQFLNTDYEEIKLSETQEASEFARGFKETYVKDYLSQYSVVKEENPKLFREFRDYKVRPVYESSFYPTFFNLAPSMGNTILLPRPEAVINLIPIFFTEYVAVYEMTLPITFKIQSNDPNDKFVFNLALEANIDHNTPLAENRYSPYDFSSLVTNDKSLICDPIQFISEEVSLNISDPVNYGTRKLGDPLVGVDDAIVTFNCKGISECYIMQTEINGKYIAENISELNFRLPINCDPGKLEVYKYGHKRLVIDDLNPTLQTPLKLGNHEMPSKKTMELNVKLVGSGNSKFSGGKAISNTETAFLIFTNLEDDEIIEVVEVNQENQDDLTVDLTTGHYSIQGFVIHNKSFTISSEEMCSGSDGGLASLFGAGGKKCVTLPEIELESWVRGGIDLKDFEVPLNKLLQRDEITVTLVDFGIPGSYSQLQAMSDVMSDLEGRSQPPYFD